jgi:hypothetical protein
MNDMLVEDEISRVHAKSQTVFSEFEENVWIDVLKWSFETGPLRDFFDCDNETLIKKFWNERLNQF